MFWLRVEGCAGTEFGPHTPPTWETLADGGCGSASSTFALAPHSALAKGALFEILCGSQTVYTGISTEYDRNAGTLHAKGLGLCLYDYLALDGSDSATRDVGAAVAQAIARGWRGTNPDGVAGVASGDADGNPISVGALLDQYAEQTGQRWGARGDGVLYLTPDPTEPHWIVSPDVAVFGETSDDAPTRLAGRFFDGTADDTAIVGVAGKEEALDLTELGTLTLAEAEAILAGTLTLRGDTAWVNAANLSSNQITTVGGTPAFLAQVAGGHLMRSFGVGYLSRGALALDTVIGKTVYTAGDSTIQVEPVNRAPRTLRGVIAAT